MDGFPLSLKVRKFNKKASNTRKIGYKMSKQQGGKWQNAKRETKRRMTLYYQLAINREWKASN